MQRSPILAVPTECTICVETEGHLECCYTNMEIEVHEPLAQGHLVALLGIVQAFLWHNPAVIVPIVSVAGSYCVADM